MTTLGPDTSLGYCTNVHAGPSYDQTLANLQQHALAVRQHLCPGEELPVGLWLSARAARKLVAEGRTHELRSWLADHGLRVFTLNGFPYGNFHDQAVKHRVYEPDWSDPQRLAYTRDLITVLADLLPDEGEGSISTLPVGWRAFLDGDARAVETAAAHLNDLVHELARLELDTGKLIHIDLEPEPGCLLDTGRGTVGFFERYLLRDNPDAVSVRGYLRVCHDICHAAVMFEDQREVLRQYARAGLAVGKVQISSAVRVRFDELAGGDREQAKSQLQVFAEDRYLHQTVVRAPDGHTTFYEDLPLALAQAPSHGEWRVHFHVPVYLERFGLLETTRDEIQTCLPAALTQDVRHFEVETYAWGVLPEALQRPKLAEGIAEELAWVRHLAVSRAGR